MHYSNPPHNVEPKMPQNGQKARVIPGRLRPRRGLQLRINKIHWLLCQPFLFNASRITVATRSPPRPNERFLTGFKRSKCRVKQMLIFTLIQLQVGLEDRVSSRASLKESENYTASPSPPPFIHSPGFYISSGPRVFRAIFQNARENSRGSYYRRSS